jgi:hypothetical protein
MVPGNTWVTEPVSSMGSSLATRMTLESWPYLPVTPFEINDLLEASVTPWPCLKSGNRDSQCLREATKQRPPNLID